MPTVAAVVATCLDSDATIYHDQVLDMYQSSVLRIHLMKLLTRLNYALTLYAERNLTRKPHRIE